MILSRLVEVDEADGPPESVIVEFVDEVPVVAFDFCRQIADDSLVSGGLGPEIVQSYGCVAVCGLPIANTSYLPIVLLGEQEDIDGLLRDVRLLVRMLRLQGLLLLLLLVLLWLLLLMLLSWILCTLATMEFLLDFFPGIMQEVPHGERTIYRTRLQLIDR